MSRASRTPQRPTAAEVVVREGFICPICMQDLGTIGELQEHFERDHTEEDKTLLQQLKGMLLKKVGRAESPAPNPINGNLSEEEERSLVVWEAQDLGVFLSHTEHYRNVRNNRMERFMVETNKLIIRLDKLAHEAPSDPKQRAVFEKRLASWVPDQDVPICPGCGKTFKRFMRKHHCRLCGCVICNECSRFLDEDFVEQLTNPVGAFGLRRPSDESRQGSRQGSEMSPSPSSSNMKRSNSNESILSIVAAMGSMGSVGNKEKEQLVRVCEMCKSLLDRRLKQMNEKNIRTELEDINERIVFSINDAENLYPGYQEMAASLHAGETNFQLQQATELRSQLMRHFDTIDAFSKKIATLPETSSLVEQKLRSKIRLNAMDFLKSHVLTMSVLPSAEQCVQLQKTRREEKKRQLALKKAAEEERKQTLKSQNQTLKNQNQTSPGSVRRRGQPPPPPPPSKNPFEKKTLNPFEDDDGEESSLNTFDEEDDIVPLAPSSGRGGGGGGRASGGGGGGAGWSADPVSTEDIDQDDDPLLQQMAIVKKTIEQAKKAGRMDEVSSLSQNLEDLNVFYKQQVLQQL